MRFKCKFWWEKKKNSNPLEKKLLTISLWASFCCYVEQLPLEWLQVYLAIKTRKCQQWVKLCSFLLSVYFSLSQILTWGFLGKNKLTRKYFHCPELPVQSENLHVLSLSSSLTTSNYTSASHPVIIKLALSLVLSETIFSKKKIICYCFNNNFKNHFLLH